jgi:hypothetical protein
MKSWHVLVLSVSILVGCGAIATVFGLKDRYHYPAYPVENKITRIDQYTGAVELYDRDRGWVPASQLR